MLEGWQINSIITLQTAQPFGVMDAGTDVSLTGEANDRWDFYGNPKDFKSTPSGIPFFAAAEIQQSDAELCLQHQARPTAVSWGPTSGQLAALAATRTATLS